MEHLLNPRVKDIEISGIRKFYNMVAHIDDTISLTLGQPDFPTPSHIKDYAKQAVDENFTVYTHNAGFIGLREAASSYFSVKYGLDYQAEDEIIVTAGASEAIDIIFRTILMADTEVILPGPVYPGYEPIITLCGAKPVYADTTGNGFKLTAEILEPYITEKTRCIVLPYPSNPTGVSLTAEELMDIAKLVKDKDIFVLADEIYSELVYDQKHISIASFIKEQTIVINGLSKSHSMTGWRIGFILAPAAICKHILKVHQYNVTCAASVSQKAAYAALTEGIDDAKPMKEEYAKRREYVYYRLNQMNLQVVKPDGAFYFFVKLPDGYKSSLEFCLELVEKAKVAVVPGDAFSQLGEGYFRLSYAYSMDTLTTAMDRIEAFLK
ncbi:aminotransferase A [Bacillus sp. CECT 9360]|uniref:aminotransferase A n=1 Tax=Bacillus sp. CECT 9360 TaxID=2845821 RepID=UPI001E576087|nr:aminotransferase A [Bacillus sp. CECT 9360]CAH0345890.1 putative N-acetyl-LL-diaminopimelate aminotransferase [Bacillus sp. CECT 9360]